MKKYHKLHIITNFVYGHLLCRKPSSLTPAKILVVLSLWAGYFSLLIGVVACSSGQTVAPAPTNKTTSTLDLTKIPLGDGKISTAPQKGYVFACQTRFGGGGGAFKAGDWIKGSVWDATAKVLVDGDVKWPNAKISINLNGNQRQIVGNGLPSHNTGTFPIAANDDAFQYDRNPNAIREQNVRYNLPALPTEEATASCLPMGVIAFAKSGAAIFNALDLQGLDAVAHEIQDKCNGHPERDGVYHYHGPSSCAVNGDGNGQLVGYALDGFGVFYYLENGKELTNGDLDECHGHKHQIDWDGKKIELYHYHLTREYPYTLGCFRGKVTIPPPRP